MVHNPRSGLSRLACPNSGRGFPVWWSLSKVFRSYPAFVILSVYMDFTNVAKFIKLQKLWHFHYFSIYSFWNLDLTKNSDLFKMPFQVKKRSRSKFDHQIYSHQCGIGEIQWFWHFMYLYSIGYTSLEGRNYVISVVYRGIPCQDFPIFWYFQNFSGL